MSYRLFLDQHWNQSITNNHWPGKENGLTFRKRNDNMLPFFSHHVSAFGFCPCGGRSPSVGAQSPFCGAQSPLRGVSSALPSAPSPFACRWKQSEATRGVKQKRIETGAFNCVTADMTAGLSPEVPLLLCYLPLSKRTPCLPHWASSTSTFACSLAQLTKLEKSRVNITIHI